MSSLIDCTGQRFGRLVVKEMGETVRSANGRRRRNWICICDCGGTAIADLQSLKSGNTTSCGCFKIERIKETKTTHGLTKTRAYSSWGAMMNRCRNPAAEHWADYGGRGITVCDRWNSFESFLADMGHPPEGMSLDRYPDNDGNYEPTNCRWADQSDQCRNRRSNVELTFNGKTQCIAAWADELGMSQGTIKGRLRLGWSVEDVLGEPVDKTTGQYDRKAIRSRSYAERLAAVLVILRRGDGSLLIPEEVAARGTKAILAHVEWDHKHPIALGGDNHFSNLQPLTAEDHLTKTKRDVKAIAKTKRLTKKEAEFRARLLTPRDERPPKQSRWGKREFPKRRKPNDDRPSRR